MIKKKLALIIISLDECFAQKGFSGGGHKVTKHLIEGLVASGKFIIDIYCKKSSAKEIDGINSITVLGSNNFKNNLQTCLKSENYDYILSSDILLPFANNLIHSNSSKHKSKNGKNKFLQQVLKIYNAGKIKLQEKNIPRDKAVFTVSESLKNDYLINFNLDKKKVFVCYPAVDDYSEFMPSAKKDIFTIGSMAGGGLNKGGYLLLFALKRLPKTSKLKARIIFPKFHKALLFKTMINVLGLKDKIELLPKQANMQEYYKSIDCYVLPSLNEAFGLVVPEAASNFKPSIVSSTTGVRELIKDGENGFIFNRKKFPVKNLVDKLMEVENIYFNDNEKFMEISKNAHEISTKLDWKEFVDTIIDNMVRECHCEK
ncbi:MAG: glycosyltransferase family 4 protein [Candidatus Gastranaerophilales bacterium]|nr:glycosyltransferase family 4 protein [Candidatus Gastranaerophilales bacterium]